ncbi:hypothetical protein GCM10023165_39650 [Variovorax defluvii]|uniref:DUF3108 domain-containing protein n=1 Tax=Variovorax defluvii TaxID=913761 RepID=A0ABP8I4T5_9BURK
MRSEDNTPKADGTGPTTDRPSIAAAWIAFGLILAVLLGFAGLIAYRLHVQVPPADLSSELRQEHPLFPPGVSLKPVDQPVIGNLGGMPVTFPAGFVENVEYEGDPGFGEKRNGPKPERTHQLGFTSLGFRVRYPEFTVMSYKEREADRQKFSIHNTPWLDFTITAGTFFGDGEFLERKISWMNRDKNFQYEKLPGKQFGLQVYTPIGVDKSLRNYDLKRGYQSRISDRDMFVSYDSAGRVDTFIECSNRNHDAAPCEQFFYLDPALRVQLTVMYRRGMLQHWQEIQTSTKKLLLSFKVEK